MRTTLIFLFALALGLASTVAAAGEVRAFAAPMFPSNDYGAWSPDGKLIAFSSDRLGTDDIFVMSANGTQQRAVLRTNDDEWWPTWSPDGRHIAFVSDRTGLSQIYSVEVATGRVTRLTSSDTTDSTPAWGSDGRIAFRRRTSDPGTDKVTSQVYVMNGDGSGAYRLLVDEDYHLTPAWSPDGSKIAFVGGGSDDAFIDVVNADGTGRVRLTNGGYDYEPAWSADGRQLLFTRSNDDEDEDVWVMNADGSGPRKLFGTSSASEAGARFDSSGSRIVFESTATGEWQVYTMSLGGTNAKRLTGLARVISSTGRRCNVFGTAGRDVLQGTSRADVICGLGGNDVLRGAGGEDLLDGGPGNDLITGGGGEDTMLGGPGRDTFSAIDGFRDSVDGGSGSDRASLDPNDWVSRVEILE